MSVIIVFFADVENVLALWAYRCSPKILCWSVQID